MGKPNGFKPKELKAKLEKLSAVVRKAKTNPDEIRQLMQRIVPTYVVEDGPC